MRKEVKFNAGGRWIKGSIEADNDRFNIRFGFNKALLSEIKDFDGARWNPEKKYWSVKVNQRNLFQLDYLQGINVYKPYDIPYCEINVTRPLMNHQRVMVQHGLTRHYCIFAAEMGTGKTLSAIEIMEQSGFKDWWWVGPKSALRSAELEFFKWNCKVKPRILTYEGLKKTIVNWKDGDPAPHGVIFDESSRIKTPTAQRSQAAIQVADAIRREWGMEGFVILMSGSPAPKSPADWWFQCEVARPGFLKEGTIAKFKKRLGLIVEKESIQGGVYPQLITWFDSEDKCKKCGELKSSARHDFDYMAMEAGGDFHVFEKSINEVSKLYERMNGLVLVQFKKDCLDLPDKQYEIIRCKPSASIMRSASIISAKSTTVVGALTLLRELSDGFQYVEEETGTKICPTCYGDCKIMAPIGQTETIITVTEENKDTYPDLMIGDIVEIPTSNIESPIVETQEISCPNCGGSGEITTYSRSVVQLPCPKEDVIKSLLDEYSEVGRTVFYAGFTGSVDRLKSVCINQDWKYIRVDGRGWETNLPGIHTPLDMLRTFQAGGTEEIPRLALIGQPSAAGMGLTLTASPMIAYYSNDFNAESRIQSEDRIHRAGMDVNRGAKIYDIFHLSTDELIHTNLMKKRELQSLSMGSLQEALKNADYSGAREY